MINDNIGVIRVDKKFFIIKLQNEKLAYELFHTIDRKKLLLNLKSNDKGIEKYCRWKLGLSFEYDISDLIQDYLELLFSKYNNPIYLRIKNRNCEYI
jgi:hypothetical protein